MLRTKTFLTLAALLGVPALTLSAHWFGHDDRYEETREFTLPADRDVITVDGNQNGGVHLIGWNRDEIVVRAKITIHDRDDDDAEELAERIEIDLGPTIRADGPGHKWSVSFEIHAPYQSNLKLRTHNGGIHIEDMTGDIQFEAKNGGIHLNRIGGNVTGRTTNGGVHVQLQGDRWEGEKLDVVTTNGGVKLRLPEDYSARLETGTVNGGVDVDFPITVRGRINRNVNATLGDGGATIRLRTTNGGVDIRGS